MSWNNITPWIAWYRQHNWNNATTCCAFINDVQIWEMRDDCFY